MNQTTHGFCPFSSARARLVDVERLPVHVLRAAQREVQQPRADGGVREAIDRG